MRQKKRALRYGARKKRMSMSDSNSTARRRLPPYRKGCISREKIEQPEKAQRQSKGKTMQKESLDRRSFIGAALGVGSALVASAQGAPQQPQTSSTPSQRDFSRQDPVQYPDPGVVALD